MKTLTILGFLLMHSFSTLTWGADPAAPLKTGDRIVFLGDSITQAGVRPNGYVTQFSKLLMQRHPETKCEVIGAGISGNKVPDLEARLDKDVLAKEPTVVVIYIGINDVWHSQNGRGTPADKFEAGLRSLIERIRAKGARVVICTPSVIGEKRPGQNPLDGMLEEYCGISRKVAHQTGTQLLDLHQAFLSYLAANNPDNADTGILTSDGVHLSDRGNLFVAHQMLAGLQPESKPEPVLRHVVLFQFKAEVTPEQVQEVVDAFAALPSKIDTIVDFEAGTDVSVENKSEGLTHGFVVTFRDEKGRDAYLPHPEHQKFVKLVGPRLEKVLVFDYFAQPAK